MTRLFFSVFGLLFFAVSALADGVALPPGGQNHQAFRVDRTRKMEDILRENQTRVQRHGGKYLWKDYLALLDELSNRDRYIVCPGKDFIKTFDPGKVVVYMRHDIDIDPATALRMAEEEHKRGLKASYYILPTAPYYGRQTKNGVERYADMDRLYRRIQDLGHEIGVHNDLLSMMFLWNIDPMEFQKQELDYYRKAGFPVVGVVSHGSGVVLNRKLNNMWIFSEFKHQGVYPHEGRGVEYGKYSFLDFGFIYEGYIIGHNAGTSDISRLPTGMDVVRKLQSFPAGKRVSLLTHPIHWAEVKRPEKTEKSAPAVESLGSPVRSAELRSFFPVLEPDGRRYVVAGVQDHGPTGYLMLTDFATGKTEQLFNPPGVVQDDSFGALLTRDRHYFYAQASVVLSCDLKSRNWRVWGKLDPDTRYYYAFIEGEGDWLYLGGYPKCNLLALNRKTGEVRNFGRMDPEQYYILSLARDDQGWVYCGIGFAKRNLVAFHPATGEKRDLLPEKARTNGRVDVYTGQDGCAYASSGSQNYRLHGGKAETVKTCGARHPDYTGRYCSFIKTFPDGADVVLYDLENRDLAWKDKAGQIRHLPLDFRSGGSHLTGNVMLPDGTIYCSSSHPMHLAKLNGPEGKTVDYGYIAAIGGGCFTAMAASPDGLIYGGQYACGRLWRFDPQKKFFVPGISVPLWNRRDPVELAGAFRSINGSCRRLLLPDVIYFKGERHELDFAAPVNGEYLIRLLFLKDPEYGEAAIDVDGREMQRVNCNIPHGLAYSPVIAVRAKLTAGKHVLALRGTGGSRALGLAALDIAPLAFGAQPDTVLPPVNPCVIGQWAKEMGQPRALIITPDGQFGYMTGFGAYGLSGGSLVRVNLQDGTFRLFNVLPKGQSGSSLLLDGSRLLVGTTVQTQGGGKVIAELPEVMELDAESGRVLRKQVLPEGRMIGSLRFWHGQLAALTDNALFLLDKETLAIRGRIDLKHAGLLTLRRTPLMGGPEGPLWVVSTRAIWEIAKPDAPAVLRCRSEKRITGGIGVRDGWLYFIRAHEVCRMKVVSK